MATWRKRRAAYVERLDEALGRVADQLSALPGVRRISVFGSHVRGRRDLFVDFDGLVILETTASMPDRLAYLYSHVDAPVDLDLAAWTAADFQRMRERPFGRAIAVEDQVLHET